MNSGRWPINLNGLYLFRRYRGWLFPKQGKSALRGTFRAEKPNQPQFKSIYPSQECQRFLSRWQLDSAKRSPSRVGWTGTWMKSPLFGLDSNIVSIQILPREDPIGGFVEEQAESEEGVGTRAAIQGVFGAISTGRIEPA